jgi:uncharacterized protein
MRNLFLLNFLFLSLNAWSADVRLITVDGLAEKAFSPDIVRLNINVWGKGDSAKKAQVNSQNHYETLKKSVEKFKIKKEDIQTTSYDLSPNSIYEPKTNRSIVQGYTVTQGLSITLRKVDEAGEFIDSLSNDSKAMNGGVSVLSLGCDISKRGEEEKNLLAGAVASAEEKANLLARAAKVKIKGLYRLSPKMAGGPVFERQAKMMMSDANSGGTQLMTGEVKVSSEVVAEYIIE